MKGKGPRKNNFTNNDNNSQLSMASNASNNSRNSRPNSVRSSASKNQQNSMINNSKIYFRNNPAHVDEGFMPSYGINHNNIELDEQNVPDDQYNMEKIVHGKSKAAHLDEDFL